MKSFISDMDGVIYKGHSLIPGAQDFISRLQECGAKFLFLTNNSEATALNLLHKLEQLGISGLQESNFMTAGMATATFLKNQSGQRSAFVVGGSGLHYEMQKAGFELTEDSPEYVVVGKTKDFDYQILKKAVSLILKGSRFIATNPDVLDPIEEGFEPACGSLVAAIEIACNKKPYVVGKPNALMMTIAKKMLGAHSEDTVMIGDRMDTDIVGGLEAGMKTCLVLSGVSTCESLKRFPYRPDYIFESVAQVYPQEF